MIIFNFNDNLPADESIFYISYISYVYTLNPKIGHNSCHSLKDYTTNFYVLYSVNIKVIWLYILMYIYYIIRLTNGCNINITLTP
jgi:hypothetical protein